MAKASTEKATPIVARVRRRPVRTKGSVASYPAMLMTQNNHKFYLASLPVDDIFPWCFVTRRIDDPIEGFQRSLSSERADDIATYLDNSKGSIPTNIVLSAQSEIDLVYTPSLKTIKFRRDPKGFLVIDGQHRLYGYGRTKKKHRVPVAIYEGLSRVEESSLFIDINTNQRGVPAALLLDIKQVAEREDQQEKELRQLFDFLNSSPISPLSGLLSPAESKPGKISRVTFNKSVKDILEARIYSNLSREKQNLLVLNFFVAAERNIRPSKLLFKALYFEALCSLFGEVTRLSLAKHKNLKLDSLIDILAPIQNLDLTGLSTAGGVRLNKSVIVEAFQQAISSHVVASDDMV